MKKALMAFLLLAAGYAANAQPKTKWHYIYADTIMAMRYITQYDTVFGVVEYFYASTDSIGIRKDSAVMVYISDNETHVKHAGYTYSCPEWYRYKAYLLSGKEIELQQIIQFR